MKKLPLVLMLPLFLSSCKKDTGPYIQVKNIENLIYQEIRDFRIDEGEILGELLQLPDGMATMQEDLTQCGVGVESDTEGNNYITILLAKADS